MEQKKNKLLSDMIQNDTDKKMVQLVEAATDLSCGDICTLLEVAHSLPFVGNLEGGDTYIHSSVQECSRIYLHTSKEGYSSRSSVWWICTNS